MLTGVALSRLSGFRSLAVMGIAGPMLKDGLQAVSAEHLGGPSSSFHGTRSSSAPLASNDGGIIESIRSKAITSLAEIARELVKKNLPSSIMPVIEQAISTSANSLLAPVSQVEKQEPSQQQGASEGERVSIH